uniref:Peptidase S1 domain-containing protein n=1 Tax=Strigamia maritima TaxID=126957 RepID=T1JNT2_STRMM
MAYPWVSHLTHNDGFLLCGGTLITDKHVITAAHCVKDLTVDKFWVTVGDHDRTIPWEASSIRVRAIRMLIHPKYERFTFDNDIAVLTLCRPVVTRYIRPACLLAPLYDFTGHPALVVGWGVTDIFSSLSDTLQQVDIQVVSREMCLRMPLEPFETLTLTDSMICAGVVEGGKDACQGDSGGPLMWNYLGRWYVIGIVSKGYDFILQHKMNTLIHFPPPPEDGLVTVCEWENSLVALPINANTDKYTQSISNYHKLTIPGLLFAPQMSRESAREAFIQQNANKWTRTCSSWQEAGFRGVIEELSTASDQESLSRIDDVINEFTKVTNWNQSMIRAFAWHLKATKFAVAFSDDSIRIHSIKTTVVPILKHKCQKLITDMAWMPCSLSVLTVACAKCILIWQVDPTSLITRPSAGCVQVLEYPGPGPVTSLSWNPNGSIFISASPMDSRMRVWDISKEESEAVFSSPVSLVSWSPDAEFVFTASPSSTFKVWNTHTWKCETWSKLAGHCQTACWHPNSSILLFATKNDTVIYGLDFSNAKNNLSKKGESGIDDVISVANLASVTLETNDGNVEIGGFIRSMVWDPNGERLAIIFAKKDGAKSAQKYVAVFRTRINPYLELTPCGFIRGAANEVPQLITFQKNFENGSLLTVCWTHEFTGVSRVSFIPMHYISSAAINAKGFAVGSPFIKEPP